MGALGTIVLVWCLMGRSEAVAEAAPQSPPEREPELTSPVWRPPDVPLELHWRLLELPERLAQAVLTPVLPLVVATEEYRLDRRLYDLLTNDARTAMLLPLIEYGGSDGLSAGARFTHSRLFGGPQYLELYGSIAANGDWEARGAYEQPVGTLGWRTLGGAAGWEADENFRFFGIGGDTREQDERAIDVEDISGLLFADLLDPGRAGLQARATVRYLRQRLRPGDNDGVQSLTRGDPSVRPPVGFGRWLDIPAANIGLAYDARNSAGRTTRGLLAALDLTVMRDLNGVGASSMRARAEVAAALELLPGARVLILAAGGGAAMPLPGDSRLPLDGHVVLGRDNHLRGYAKGRFLDRGAWWASTEYRYPVFLYEQSGFGFSAVFFADAGRAGDELEELFAMAPRWSLGAGIRGETMLRLLFELQAGFSPEGMEIIFRVGEVP